MSPFHALHTESAKEEHQTLVPSKAECGLCCATEGAPWETSSQATGSTTDSYQWARVEMPAEHGKVIQVSAGQPHAVIPLCPLLIPCSYSRHLCWPSQTLPVA